MSFVLDTFTAANGTLLSAHSGEVGATWTVRSGVSPTIDSNEIWDSDAGVSIVTASGVPPSADYSVVAALHKLTAVGEWTGLVARYTDTTHYYMLIYNRQNDRLELYVQNGGFTSLGNTGALGIANGQAFTMELQVSGTTISVRFNGVVVISVTNAALASTGQAGVLFFGTGQSAIAGIHMTAIRADPPLTTIAVSDANLFFSPYNWQPNGATWKQATAPGAYIETVFSGRNGRLAVSVAPLAGVAAANYPYVRVTLDGTPGTSTLMVSGQTEIMVGYDLTDALHTVRIDFMASGVEDRWVTPEETVRVTGLQVDAGTSLTAPTLESKRLIFFGDSITEGVYPNVTYLNGNATLTTCKMFADALGCEYGQIGYQQQGYTAAGAGGVPAGLVPGNAAATAYDKYVSGVSRLTATLFSPAPDYVFCWWGQNDGGAADVTLTARVVATISAFRAAAPLADIFILIPSKLIKEAAISAGVAAYNAANPSDTKVFLIDTGVNYTLTPAYVIADDIHLTAAGQQAYFDDAYPLVLADLEPVPVPPIGTPLLPCQCVAGMTVQYQMAYIYEALKQLAGSPADLPDFQCVLGSPQQSKLAYIYCATLAWKNS